MFREETGSLSISLNNLSIASCFKFRFIVFLPGSFGGGTSKLGSKLIILSFSLSLFWLCWLSFEFSELVSESIPSSSSWPAFNSGFEGEDIVLCNSFLTITFPSSHFCLFRQGQFLRTFSNSWIHMVSVDYV